MADLQTATEQTHVILGRNLRKSYGTREVVRGIDVRIANGVCFGLLGPNGAGKTTTLRMILGQTPMGAGELQVFGLDASRWHRRIRANVGLVPQTDNLDPDFTVAENLLIYGSYFGLDRETIAARTSDLLALVELSDRHDQRIQTLSGGMKRRLTLARSLINNPELLVLDEPTTGLDPQARHLIWGLLRRLKRAGKTLVLTTHYMEEAERLCDELVVIDDGRILDTGKPNELIARHCLPEVIEIRDSSDDKMIDYLQQTAESSEQVGDTLYLYATKATELIERLESGTDTVYLHRPANLEDVFLHLTGRGLRD